ncbi:hypothetical protein V1508DRAFT_444775 [Lipomyces doorenjongii]|uniref:uncharacterized protein n=1 Tax=Lipomyces doorenjongii TaxID=383834 RepID=UPI0034CD6EEB
MSVIGDLDNTESATRGVQAPRQVAELYISSQPARKTKNCAQIGINYEDKSSCSQAWPMEQSDLMGVVRRPLSPDAKIEVPASWNEYEYAQELLDTEGNKFPRLCYDSTRRHHMVGELVGSLANSCNEILLRGGISADIRRRVSQATDITKYRQAVRGLTIREWDGALRYLSYRSLQEAISWCVCALHCHLGIAMCLNERPRGAKSDVQYYANEEEAAAAIQQATNELRLQLHQNPFGPLVRNGVTWFGTLEKVVIETFRCEETNCPPGTLLYPTRFFVNIPPNLEEVVLGDCVPSHVLNGHEILATPVDVFQKSWIEAKISSAIFETAVERIENKCLISESTGC